MAAFCLASLYPSPKSRSRQNSYNLVQMAAFLGTTTLRTLVERRRELKRVDKLGVKPRRHLNTHTTYEEPEVKMSEIGLPVPWRLVRRDDGRDEGVRPMSFIENRHCGHAWYAASAVLREVYEG